MKSAGNKIWRELVSQRRNILSREPGTNRNDLRLDGCPDPVVFILVEDDGPRTAFFVVSHRSLVRSRRGLLRKHAQVQFVNEVDVLPRLRYHVHCLATTVVGGDASVFAIAVAAKDRLVRRWQIA